MHIEAMSAITSQYKNGGVMGGTMYREPMKRLTFTYICHGENSGETYRLSSDGEAYIFVLLKGPRAGFL